MASRQGAARVQRAAGFLDLFDKCWDEPEAVELLHDELGDDEMVADARRRLAWHEARAKRKRQHA